MRTDIKLLLKSYESQFDSGTLAWAMRVHHCICANLPLIWARKGTWIEAWNGKRRIAFAPHQSGCSIYFRGPAAIERYRELGGCCPAGRVSIRIPIDAEFEDRLLMRIVVEHLHLAHRLS